MKSEQPDRKPSARSNPATTSTNRIANLEKKAALAKRKAKSRAKAKPKPKEKELGKTGAVYWLTGLSGSGKTTLGRRLVRQLRRDDPSTVLIDGDTLRAVFGRDLGYSLADRRKAAMRIARLCRLLSDQGIDVVCATVSLFHDIQRWNRRNVPGYVEVYLDVPLPELYRRDPQGTYARALSGEINQVIGVDLPMEEPESPDIHLVVSDEKPRETMQRLWGAVQDIQEGAAIR